MFKDIIGVLYGAVIWQILRIRLGMNKRKVILVLTGENQVLDKYALLHLKDFMNRNYADGAVIISSDKEMQKEMAKVKRTGFHVPVKWYECREGWLEKLYHYYSFYNFSDKIVFTYTSGPKDNQLGKLLSETDVKEEEAVCLGLYRLRAVSYIREECP